MVVYSIEENYDMFIVFIDSQRNSELASELYLNRFPERRQPDSRIFERLDFNLQRFGSFNKPRSKKYLKIAAEEDEINVLASVINTPNTSCREMEEQLGISRTRCLQILKKHKYRPYKVRKIHNLHLGDAQRRLNFCRWYIGKCQENENFPMQIIWSDEAFICSDGIFNRNINYHWSQYNQHVTVPLRRQGRFGFSVWCGILGNKLIGPVIFNHNLTAVAYVEILRAHITEFIDNMPLNQRAGGIWFQQDGAPAHNSRAATAFLNEEFANRWLGTNGPVKWPARSPDLTPLDFFLGLFKK